MKETAASPDWVLRAGQTYDVPDAVAKQLLAADPPACTADVTPKQAEAAKQLPNTPDPDDKGAANTVQTPKKK